MPINKSRHLSLPNGTTFPVLGDGLSWKLRHGWVELTRAEKMHLASIVDAYAQLIRCTNAERNETVNLIKQELKKCQIINN